MLCIGKNENERVWSVATIRRLEASKTKLSCVRVFFRALVVLSVFIRGDSSINAVRIIVHIDFILPVWLYVANRIPTKRSRRTAQPEEEKSIIYTKLRAYIVCCLYLPKSKLSRAGLNYQNGIHPRVRRVNLHSWAAAQRISAYFATQTDQYTNILSLHLYTERTVRLLPWNRAQL